MPFPLRRSVALLSLSMLGASAQAAEAAETTASWRLFVTDHAGPTITALDLDQPENTWTFELDGPSRVYAPPSGETIVAVQMDHDSVAFIDSGIEMNRHDDHGEITVQDPTLIEATLSGDRPFHVVFHDGVMATNFDRGGYVEMVDLGSLRNGEVATERFDQNRPHHGFGAPIGDAIVSSVASAETMEEDKLPPRIGLAAYERDGTLIGQVATCTDLHGEAFSGQYLATGCREGVLLVSQADGAPEFRMLPYPEDFPDEKTGKLLGVKAEQRFLGNHGDKAVVVIDPEQPPYFQRVELPFRPLDFVLDPARPEFAYLLTEDGTLHRFNLRSTEVEQSVSVTQPYSMDGHWTDPRPRLAVAGDHVVVTDPLEGLVKVVDGDALTMTNQIELAGMPYNIVAVGTAGVTLGQDAVDAAAAAPADDGVRIREQAAQ